VTYRTTVRGCGRYLPERVMTNDEIATLVDTSDEWIYTRTGIRKRHIVAPGETTSSMAVHAARAALESAGMAGEEIDLTILATCTPDYGFPAGACVVQDAVGARGGAYDLEAACSGFVYGLASACSLIQAGIARNALVIGSEVYSRVLDWQDRRTCILFGDGAGAMVISRAEHPGPQPAFRLGSDGAGASMLVMPGGGLAEMDENGRIPRGVRMDGPETFKFGVRIVVEVTEQILRDTGLCVDDLDWLVLHQANQRIISAAAKRLGIADDKVMSNIEHYGNTSAASIPIAATDWVERGAVLPGQKLLMIGFGGGLTWAAGLLTWRD
jgi:3-oxoacyl-[acyl-carrier-protein] synthase III